MKARVRFTPAIVRRLAMGIATASVALALPATAYAAPVRVMIDPGHGGKDPGAVSGGLVEKKLNLQISRAVAKEARRQGWNVAMTRNSDKFIPLEKRPARASTYRADVFVSIHANSTGKAHKGAMTIYRGKQGKRLGRAIMGELAPITRYKDIGNRSDVRGLAVLRASKKPAVIVEVMSVTAPHERKRIKNPKVQKRVAQAIVRGIAKYEGVRYKAPSQPKPKKKTAPTPVTELTPTAPATAKVPTEAPATAKAVDTAKKSPTAPSTAGAAKGSESRKADAGDTAAPKRASEKRELREAPTTQDRPVASPSRTARFFAKIFGLLGR